MEDLAKFFVDIIEFVVAGVFFVASILLVGSVVATGSLNSVVDQVAHPTAGLSGVYTGVGLVVAYAMGILAEGLSRLVSEWRLVQLTERAFPASKDPIGEREARRVAVTAADDELSSLVSTQLKRLRIERSLALSGVIASFALVVSANFAAGLLVAVLTAGAVLLVDQRFRRYLGTIITCHAVLETRLRPAQEPE